MKYTLKGKLDRKELDSLVDLDVTYDLSYSADYTVVDYSGEDEEVFTNFLRSNYEAAHLFRDLAVGNYTGRLVDVGKYGFGIFCDINSEKEVLISLVSLRGTFGGGLPTREYIYKMGLIEDLCVSVNITRIERGTGKVWGEISKEWADRYLKVGRITVSRTSYEELRGAIEGSSFKSSLDIIKLCKGSFAISCKSGIDPPGIVHLIGSKLRRARLGIVGGI